jgi:hypothetical protein
MKQIPSKDFRHQWINKNYLIYCHPFGCPDLSTPTEKMTLECPIPFTVTTMTEVFFHSTIVRFDIHLINQFNVIPVTFWACHGISAFLNQSQMHDL